MPRKSAANLSVIPVNVEPPRLDPPATLTDPERTLFVQIVRDCPPTHFAKSDVHLLVSFVQSTLLSRQAVTKAANDPAALAY